MRLIFHHQNVDHEYLVDGGVTPSTTLAELIEPMLASVGSAVPIDSLSSICVDGRPTVATASLATARVLDGSFITVNNLCSNSHESPATTVDIVGGLNSGHRFALDERRLVVGRSPDADITLTSSTADPYHLAIDNDGSHVRLTDLDSLNGTLVANQWLATPTVAAPGAIVDVGTAQLTVRSAVDDHPNELLTLRSRNTAGHLTLNRPPRSALPVEPTTIEVPAHTPASSLASFFSWIGLLAPLALGALMAWLYNPLFALFALLGPVMMVGSWFEGRRRDKKNKRSNHRQLQNDLNDLAQRIDALLHTELSRRRSRCPDLAELVRRVFQPSTTLWQRRLDHDDALELLVGTANLAWPLNPIADGPPEPAAVDMIAERSVLNNSPLIVDAGPGNMIGLVGPRATTLAIARSLVLQTAIHHGPADVGVVVLTNARSAPSWAWASWLPHTRSRANRGRSRAIACNPKAISDLVTDLIEAKGAAGAARNSQPRQPVLMCVIDGDGLATGRSSPTRTLLSGAAGPISGIVIAASLDRLPQSCTSVIDVTDPDGVGRVATPAKNKVIDRALLAGMPEPVAVETARRLARFADPEVDLTEAAIPAIVPLVELLDLHAPSAAAITERWNTKARCCSLTVPIGADGLGTLSIDLVADGPHTLIGGTTGSGKSELLRSLVVGLAANYSPAELNFVLIDYKGGSAFDRCAGLPHTVGLVTDLDEHLGARALSCLDAELHYRERALRAAGATNIDEYQAEERAETLPRLVVVIDEFATLAAELPDFLDALVGIAQRGRSLGVHLILATQRPSGAISPSIRTNTNLRIALRVLDPSDSSDVIDQTDAATIARDQPGRAYARLGPSEVVAFQSALVTGHTPQSQTHSIRVVPLNATPQPDSVDVDGPSDLHRLVVAIVAAHQESDARPPRCPWPVALVDHISLHQLAPLPIGCTDVAVGMVDLPHQQRQETAGWDLTLGNLALVGMAGSGTSTALATVACALASRYSSDCAHIYVIDHSGSLRALHALAHVGSVVESTDTARQLRLIRQLDAERRRRSILTGEALAAEPLTVLLVDGYGSWRDEMETLRNYEAIDMFDRLYADGPAVGLHCAVAADHAGALNRAVLATTAQIWMFRMADPSDYLVLGSRIEATSIPPGRAFSASNGHEMQFALPHESGIEVAVADIAARLDPSVPCAPPVGELPANVAVDEMGAGTTVSPSGPLWLPVAIGDEHLEAVGLELYSGEHALIAGRARTGKTTALVAIAQTLHQAGVEVVGLATNRSLLADATTLTHATSSEADALDAVASCRGPNVVLLVDDAERFTDPTGALLALVEGLPNELRRVHVIAAGNTDRLISAYGHWTTGVRSSRVGVLLRPDVLDGDLLGTQLPLKAASTTAPGRGWLIAAGRAQLCQLAEPTVTAKAHGQASRLMRSA